MGDIFLNAERFVQDGLSESNGGAGDRVSVLMPIVPFDPSAILQPLPLDSRPENDLPIATVPTANGGTRRKHHRPWTLREVMTLVEGVARCGGGKWADIKKLAFSNVGYRTAVDLKVSCLMVSRYRFSLLSEIPRFLVVDFVCYQ